MKYKNNFHYYSMFHRAVKNIKKEIYYANFNHNQCNFMVLYFTNFNEEVGVI